MVAQLLGIKTATLAKWRRQGRGPAGWFHVSTTLVVYPAQHVEQFLAMKRTGSGD
jgi:transposase-like protein